MKKHTLFAATLAVALALCGFAQAQANAPAARDQRLGPYAAHSAKYAEYLQKCDAGDMPARLHDQAARLVESMSPEQYRLHLANCTKRVVSKPATTVAQYRRGGGVEVDVEVGGRRPPHRGASRGGDLTPEELALMKRRFQQKFGPPPAGTVDYGAMYVPDNGAPAPGCHRKIKADDREMGVPLARWRCPPGTARKLGLVR